MAVEVKDSKALQEKLTEAGGKLVVIDFHAQWCGPCKVIGPKFVELSKEVTDVVFLKVDVDESEDIAEEYDISSMPTFVFIKNKTKIDQLVGANYEALKELVTKHK